MTKGEWRMTSGVRVASTQEIWRVANDEAVPYSLFPET